jgi:NAD(P)-dependent dehydrogenase (short-subunit alcohol dehydrogenase family)
MMNPPVRDWAGKRVWVIGASSGIGAETARSLLSKGARVALSARRPDALAVVAAGHAHALVAPADMTRCARRDPSPVGRN